MQPAKRYDVAVVGAGCFGAWAAHHLARAGRSVLLLDAFGPASVRASSGGETRILRAAYGAAEVYARFARRSRELWRALEAELALPLYIETGVLWLARAEDDGEAERSAATFDGLGVPYERLELAEVRRRFPQLEPSGYGWALWESEAGALYARRAVQGLVARLAASGVDVADARIEPVPAGSGRLEWIESTAGARFAARDFVFACGPWLGKVFPDRLGSRLFVTRQAVCYFGRPPGDGRFLEPALPVWLEDGERMYGFPDLEGRGVKVAQDLHGPPFDPDAGDRRVTEEEAAQARSFVERLMPALRGAPLVAAEVCQYENTSSGDFLIDRHPARENVWWLGGGSGHGFKHGPAVGEHLAQHLLHGSNLDPRFQYATKGEEPARSVF